MGQALGRGLGGTEGGLGGPGGGQLCWRGWRVVSACVSAVLCVCVCPQLRVSRVTSTDKQVCLLRCMVGVHPWSVSAEGFVCEHPGFLSVLKICA